MSKTARWLLLIPCVLLSACATMQKHATSGTANSGDVVSPVGDVPPKIKENEASSEIVEENIERPYKSSYGEVDMTDNQYVEQWVRYFQGKGRRYMEQYLARSTRYLPMMKNVLRENGLPEELVYISLIESGFSPQAHSRSNAVGYWQFIRSTGRRFGLTVDPFIDERRDPVLSTRAAAEYFKELYSLFGSWDLALSAYNTGENRVRRAVTRYYTRDFWQLIRKGRALPRETKQYVPKFIAATLIAKDPQKYGFTGLEYQDPLSYDAVTLQSPISLTKLASNMGVDVEEMKLLNPKFRSDYVPLAKGSETVIRIPVGRGTDAVAALSMSVTSQPKIAMSADYFFYHVHRGDNLSTIAHRHRTTVSQLRRLNNLSNRVLLRVGMALRVPDHRDSVRLVSEEDAQTGATSVGAISAVEVRALDYHIVRRGENLSTIAHRYGVSVGELKRLNNLSSRSLIRKGQKLKIRAETPRSARQLRTSRAFAMFKSNSATKSTHASRSKSPRRSVAGNTRQHVVRRGETLYVLSKKYGVPLNELAKANGHKVNYRVMAGEHIVIPE